MMGTDFFDEDLLKPRSGGLKIKLGENDTTPRDGHITPSGEMPTRPVSDLSLTHLARHKHEVNEQMVDKVQELERLKTRQEELERERHNLRELSRKQDEFDSGRRELRTRLTEGLIRMEKEQQQAERLGEFLEETRATFRNQLQEVESLNEELWSDEEILDNLNTSLVLLENIRGDYNKAMAKWDVMRPHASIRGGPAAVKDEDGLFFEGISSHLTKKETHGFGFWFRVGFGFTLPLVSAMLLMGIVWLFLRWMGWI